MRRKAPLTMMELMVMTVVFALCAALCLQAFVTADRISRRAEERDRAVVLCQSAAELLRHYGGDLEPLTGILEESKQDGYFLWQVYDGNWKPIPEEEVGSYQLVVRLQETGEPGLGKALVGVYPIGPEPDPIFTLEVAWQKGVTPHA